MHIRTSNCIALSTVDMAAARAHYVEVLGFEVVKETGQWIELGTGALRIFLCQDAEPVQPTSTCLSHPFPTPWSICWPMVGSEWN